MELNLHIPYDNIAFQILQHLSGLGLLVPIKRTRRTKKHSRNIMYHKCNSVSNLYLPAALRRALHILLCPYIQSAPALFAFRAALSSLFPSTLSFKNGIASFHNFLLTRINLFQRVNETVTSMPFLTLQLLPLFVGMS